MNRLQHIVIGLVLALVITSVFAEEAQNCTIICNTIGGQTYCTQTCY